MWALDPAQGSIGGMDTKYATLSPRHPSQISAHSNNSKCTLDHSSILRSKYTHDDLSRTISVIGVFDLPFQRRISGDSNFRRFQSSLLEEVAESQPFDMSFFTSIFEHWVGGLLIVPPTLHNIALTLMTLV